MANLSDDATASQSPNHAKRMRLMRFLVAVLILSAIAAAVIWWLFYRNYEATDDAYVNGNIIVLSSRQEGSVVSCYVVTTDLVREGDLLVRLDPTDFLVNVEQKKAALALAARNVRELYEDVNQKGANVKVETAKYDRAALNFKNRQPLLDTEAIPQEDIEHAEADFKVQRASLDLAHFQLEAAKAALGTAPLKEHPAIENAKCELIEALLAHSRCGIKAPVTGYIANKNVQVGQSVKAGTPLLNIIPLNEIWVDANFKETQLQNLRIGQAATLISDMYGSAVSFNGKIVGLQPGTGSTFSLLPTQNATGNWIKIVQRVAVKISLDQEQVQKFPLVLGLSMTVSVDILDTSGERLIEKPVQQIAKTAVFDVDLNEFNPIIDQIIENNLQLPSEGVKE